MWTARCLSLGALLCTAAACRDEHPLLHAPQAPAPVQTSSTGDSYVQGPAAALRVITQPGQVSTDTLFTVTTEFVDANNRIAIAPPLGDITVTLTGNSNVHLGGVVEKPSAMTVTFDALHVTGAGDNVTLHFAIGSISGDSNAFSVHDNAWAMRATMAVGAAPPKGSGRMWFSDVIIPSTRLGTGDGYDFGQLRMSNDGGNTLIAVGNTNAIMGLAEDPFDANHLIAQDQLGAVWGSHDSGQTWSLLLPMVGNTTAEFYPSVLPQILFDPLVQGRLHVMGGLGIDYALHRSDDGGQTWIVELACTYASIDSQGNLYAVIPNPNFLVVYSANAGRSWVAINPNFASGEFQSPPVGIAADPQVLGTAYLVVSEVSPALYVTSNYGTSWQPVSLVPMLPYADFLRAQESTSLTACNASGQTSIYVGSSDSFLVTSPDHGATWEYAGYGVPEMGAHGIACDPNDVTHVFASGAKTSYETRTGGR